MQVQILDLFDKTETLANFIALKNEQVVSSLSSGISQFIHISGISGSGKTHLLKGWVNSRLPLKIGAVYLTQTLGDYSVNDLLKYQAIAVDNVEDLIDNDQIKLFDLFNKIKLGNLPNQLLTSSVNPDLITLREDLRTRILSGLNLHLKSLSDEEIIKALHDRAEIDGIGISEVELKFLVNHYTRNIGELVSVLHKVAESALVENKRITSPFIKHVL